MISNEFVFNLFYIILLYDVFPERHMISTEHYSLFSLVYLKKSEIISNESLFFFRDILHSILSSGMWREAGMFLFSFQNCLIVKYDHKRVLTGIKEQGAKPRISISVGMDK